MSSQGPIAWCPECGGLYDPAEGWRVTELPFGDGRYSDDPMELITIEACSQECLLAWLKDTA